MFFPDYRALTSKSTIKAHSAQAVIRLQPTQCLEVQSRRLASARSVVGVQHLGVEELRLVAEPPTRRLHPVLELRYSDKTRQELLAEAGCLVRNQQPHLELQRVRSANDLNIHTH